MQRQIVRIALLVLLVLTTVQTTQAQYVVKAGDSLWKIAGTEKLDAQKWGQIYTDNPFLAEEHRRFEKDGVIYVLLKPGEVLKGFDTHGGLTPTIEELKTPDAKVVEVEKKPWWLIPLILLLAVGLAAWWITRPDPEAERLAEARLNADPVTSGPPIVPGGVTPETVDQRFQEQAARQWQSETNRTAETRMFTILRSTRGRGWGIIEVTYADGSTENRRLAGQVVYYAEVRFPDGNIENLYMLQGCGNDLRFGNIRSYNPTADNFRFEPDLQTPAVTPVPETAPVVPAELVTTPVVEEGVIKIEIRKRLGVEPAMIRMSGVDDRGDHTIELGKNMVTVRYTPK